MEVKNQEETSKPNDEKEITFAQRAYYLFSLFRVYISIGFCVPFIAGATFAYIQLGFNHGPPIWELTIPILVGLFMGCGFFGLDSLYDVETDKYNPRQKTLPHVLDKNLVPRKWVITSVILFFSAGIALSGILSLYISILLGRIHLNHFLLSILGAAGGVLYTTPPFRFKGRPILDLLINIVTFGVVGSLYGWTMYSNIIFIFSPYGWYVIPFSCVITYIVVFPTPMIDYEPDKKANVKSTVVTLGLEKYAKYGLIALIGMSVFMTYAEIKIFLDFNLYLGLNFGLPHLIGLLVIGYAIIVPYIVLYRQPTPRTAFYITGVVSILIFFGVLIALFALFSF